MSDDLSNDLLDQGADDPDWDNFNSNDAGWNLKLAGEAIRQYCGWHIYPNKQLTLRNLPLGSRGIITLPSMHVTDVASVMIQDPGGVHPQILDPSQYQWFTYGTIEPINWSSWGRAGGYYYGPENWTNIPVYQAGSVTVTFNSGYETLPIDVKGVAYELASTNIEVSSGNVKEIQTPGFRLQLMQAYGANLNEAQKDRLANYKIPAVI